MDRARRETMIKAAGCLVAASSCERAFAGAFLAASKASPFGTLSPFILHPQGMTSSGMTSSPMAVHPPEAPPRPPGREFIWLKRPDGQEIQTRFRDDKGYDRAQILRLSWFMRDVSDADHAVWIEPRLFDLIAGVQAGMSAVHGAPVPLILTSGYRTPAHNAKLETAARNSMHLYGYAADLKAPGYSPRAVALAASFFAKGGIGLYDGFTHLDVWKVRTWMGPSHNSPVPGHAAPVPPRMPA